MTRHEDALIARAKSLAIPVASCVAASLRPDHLLRASTKDGLLAKDELLALVIVLAEAADPVRLREVVAAGEDEVTPPDPRELVLRRAHADAASLRSRGLPVPPVLGLLECEYLSGRKAAQRAREAAKEAEARRLLLKDAHAEVVRLRRNKQPVPRELLVLDAEYRRDSRRRQREVAA
jgi:hypothetical protein